MPEPDATVATGRLDAVDTALDDVHAALARLWASAPDIDERDRSLVDLAVAEIVANVIRHGDGDSFTVELARRGGTVEAVITDSASPIDPALLTDSALPPDDAESGRGFALVRAAVHELRYETAHGANRWTLVRRLP